MITIKKYGNRRLYDTSRAAYVNLDDVAELVRAGQELRVVDAKTEQDLTRDVLLQVVIEVLRGADVLPVGMLRRIIRSTSDDPVQQLVRTQLTAGLSLLSGQLDRAEAMLGWSKPAASPAASAASPDAPREQPAEEPVAPATGGDDPELDALRARLAALESRLTRG